MTVDYGLWNAIVSTVTLLVVVATAISALRQIRHLRAQNTLNGLLKVLDDWRDPKFQEWMRYVRLELPKRVKEPGFFDDLDVRAIDRGKHPEINICDWYEQVGSYMKYGLLDERTMMDVSSGSCKAAWDCIQPVIERMRQTRGDMLYENFEYMAVRGTLFIRANPDGCYPRGVPRMRDLQVKREDGALAG